MESYIKEGKEQGIKDQLRQENEQIQTFLETPEVAELFTKYDYSL